MVRHVTSQRSYGHISQLNRVVVCAICGIRIEILFTDPKVRLATWINVFGNHRSRVLNALSGNFNAFDLARRNIDVKKRPLRKPFLKNFASGNDTKGSRLRKIKMLARDEAECQARDAQNS